jgi:hypothetical protein
VLCLLALAVAGAASASPARAEVKWLCRPGLAGQPCAGDQTTRYFAPDGSSRVGKPASVARPAIDCFYVYPTVSNQPTKNATQTADPEVRSIAKYQAQRFSTRCRVFAPLYQEVTAVGVATASQTHDTSGYSLAFGDIREAWRSYLRDDNHGRGFVLIGHSQGSRMLRALIRQEIDPQPTLRRRLVGAIIPGANATVARGRLVGGDFKHIPMCTRPAQTGCVISYSTFNKTPPDNSRFGRTDTDPVGGALGLPAGPGTEVMCADPAKLSGSAELESLVPSEPFAPGIIAALLVKLYGGPPPSADTPWLQPTDHYTGRCRLANGSHVLMLSPVDGARTLTPSPDDTWGTHLVDVNIALGNLTDIVGAQSRAWVRAHAPARGRALRVGLRANGHALVVSLSGAPLERVRVTVGELSRRVRLGSSGSRVLRFRVDEEGLYRAVVHGSGGKVARSKRVRVR